MRKLFFIILFFTIACSKAPFEWMIEEGKQTSETRLLQHFYALHINDIFEVTLVNDTNFYVTVHCGENILPFIKTEVAAGVLTIDNTIKGRWARPYHRPGIILHGSYLSEIRINEASTVASADSLCFESLFLHTNTDLVSVNLCLKGHFFDFANRYTTSGRCVFSGEVKQAKLFSGGTTQVDASSLKTDSAIVFHNSVAAMHVWVEKQITELRNFKHAPLFIKGKPFVHFYTPADSLQVFFVEN